MLNRENSYDQSIRPISRQSSNPNVIVQQSNYNMDLNNSKQITNQNNLNRSNSNLRLERLNSKSFIEPQLNPNQIKITTKSEYNSNKSTKNIFKNDLKDLKDLKNLLEPDSKKAPISVEIKKSVNELKKSVTEIKNHFNKNDQLNNNNHFNKSDKSDKSDISVTNYQNYQNYPTSEYFEEIDDAYKI